MAGERSEPWVSVPNEKVKRFSFTPAAEPLDEPLTSSCMSSGWRHWPPTAENPEGTFSVNAYAHSDRFVRPSIRQPNGKIKIPLVSLVEQSLTLLTKFFTTGASCFIFFSWRTKAPASLYMSRTLMLPFTLPRSLLTVGFELSCHSVADLTLRLRWVDVDSIQWLPFDNHWSLESVSDRINTDSCS